MRKLLVLLASLALSSIAYADTFNTFNPGPAGPVKSNGTYKLVAETAPDLIALWSGCGVGAPVLSWTGACIAGGSGGTPAGVNTQIQFNNSGAFGASANLTFNTGTNFLALAGYHSFTDQTAPATPAAATIDVYSSTFQSSGISQLTVLDEFGGSMSLGVEQHMVVYNTTGSTMTAGNLVYINGSHATTPTVALAEANSATTLPAVGFTQYSIPNNAYGEIHISGNVTTTTTGTAVGNPIYVSSTTPGAFTTTAPTASGTFAQQVGVITNVAGAGSGNIQLLFETPIAAILTVPAGGSGAGTFTAHGVLLGEGTSAFAAMASLAADNLLLGQGAADPAAVALVNCGDATHALAYSTSTHTFACQAITATATPGGSTTQVQFNLSSAFAGDAGFTYVGSTTQTLGLGTAATGPTIQLPTSSGIGRTFAINGSAGNAQDGGPINISAGNAGTGANTGGALSFSGGVGSSGGAGGASTFKGGLGGSTGAGGVGTLSGGPATSGTGGVASVVGGNVSTSGVGGAVTITAGTSAGTNQAGANVTLTAGSPTGSGAVGVISLASPSSFSSSLRSIGPKFTLGTGTGACATSSTLLGGAVAGSFVCTGTAGASSQVINLPTLPSGGTSYSCTASDATSGVAWATQVGTTATGKIAGTITTTSDVVVFHCIGY